MAIAPNAVNFTGATVQVGSGVAIVYGTLIGGTFADAALINTAYANWTNTAIASFSLFGGSGGGGGGGDGQLPSDGSTPTTGSPLVIQNANGVTISGQELAYGVEIINSTNVTIENDTIGVDQSGMLTGNPNYGISVDSASSHITISGNTIADNGGAGVVVAGNNVTITNSEFSGNSGGGILVNGGSAVTITGNTIGDGVALENASFVTIQGNWIGVDQSGNALGNDFDGIYADSGSNNLTIGGVSSGQGNILADNGGAGIDLAASGVQVTANYIYGNGSDGIMLVGASGVTITGNTLGKDQPGDALGNQLDGIYVDPASNNTVIGGTGSQANVIAANGEVGIVVAGSSVSIVGNTTSDNALGGMFIGVGSNVTITDNTINDGVALYSANNVTIGAGNTISNSVVVGGSSVVALNGNALDSLTLISGVATLSGVTSIGNVTVLGGAGTLSGNVDNSGTIGLGAPYARGTLTITGNYTQESSGAINLTLDSQSLTTLDHLMIDGVANLNGSFNVALVSGYTPTSGNVFDPLLYGSRDGVFATLSLPSYSGGSLSAHYDDPLDPNSLSLWAS